MKLVFATNNKNKLDEIKQLLNSSMNILSLEDIDCKEDIPETGNTIEINARQKSNYIYEKYGLDCFADDTGLEVEALNGDPGVYSARYAGEEKNAENNMQLVLQKLTNISNRKARFKTVISLMLNGEEYQFEGIVDGYITESVLGNKGFGYDPIFRPEGYTQTFAELAQEEKNKISHRGRAVAKLISFLKEQTY